MKNKSKGKHSKEAGEKQYYLKKQETMKDRRQWETICEIVNEK